MSGYFKSLVKQSGVSIGVRNSSAVARETVARPLAPDRITPPHRESVAMVEPTAGELNHFETRTTENQAAATFGERVATRAPIANENDAATDIPTIVSHRTRSTQTEQAALNQSESNLAQENSTDPAMPARRAGAMMELSVLQHDVIENPTETPAGVIRVGEHRSASDRELATESDPLGETARALAQSKFSIPPDYLEGIREWLASPPVNTDDVTTDRLIEHHDNDSPEPRESDRSLRPNIELNLSAPDELQEFSLSIGSISITVEEPARQPSPPTTLQPIERSPANTQPPASDAFALSRSYFRGF